jgi:tagatose-1,6-bisphosphate aldolase
LSQRSKIRFTKHAYEKIEFVKNYGFEIDEKKIVETIRNPTRLDQRGDQYFAIKPLDINHALRVVYEKRKEYLVVITFYPVRRERYGV